MKKNGINWSGILMILVGVGGGMLASLALTTTNLITEEDSLASMSLKIVLLFVAFFIATYIQVVIHESGHLVAGLISGYHFVSFRIGQLMMSRGKDGKIALSRYSLAGTAGQCIMGPPDYSPEFKTTLYNYGGVIANLIAAVICGILYFLIPVTYLKLFNFVMAVSGLMNAILNGVPMVTATVANDGYNEKEVHNNEMARKAFWAQLKYTELLTEGKAPEEMPAALFEFEPVKDNLVINSSYIMKINSFMNSKQYRKCRKLMEDFLKEDYKVNPLHKQMLETDLLFCRLIDGEEVSYDYNGMTDFFARNKTALNVIRTQYAYEKLVMQNVPMADAMMKRFEKNAARYPFARDVETERGLIALADSKVYNKK